MAEKNVKDVSISGSADKRSITATFVETLDGSFLPYQLIYKGKTTQSLLKLDFPDGFSLIVNKKHFSSTQESIKFLKEIVIPFVYKKKIRIEKSESSCLANLGCFQGTKGDTRTRLLERK